MATRLRSLAVVLGAAALSVVVVAVAENPVGTWAGTTEVPDQGPDAVTLTITKTGSGFAGTMADSLGQVASDPLREVTFADGVLTFGFALADGTPMRMKLTVTGDKMAGEWQHPEGSAGAILLERKKGS